MILQAWGGAAVLVAASLVLGYAIDRVGGRCGGASPAVGLAALVIIAYTGLNLPGGAVTAAALCLVISVGATALLLVRARSARRGVRRSLGGPSGEPARPLRRLSPLGADVVVAVVTGGLAALGAAIPFVANGRVGLLGVSLDNDTANHMIWAEALRTSAVKARYGLPSGYPLGPHSVADTLATGLGLRLDMAFVALGIATIVITALVGASAIRGQAAWKRVPTGVLAALLYLVAAYYAEGAFKEPLFGLLLLAFVLVLEDLRRTPTSSVRSRTGILIGAGILAAGSLYVFSYPALAWLALTVAIWLAAELVAHARRVPGWLRGWGAQRSSIRPLLAPVLGAAVLTGVMLVPTAGRISSFAGSVGTSPAATGAITTSNLGNLAGPLSAYEGLGIWNRTDFRFAPDNVFHAGELGALALGVLLLGLGFSLARRELVLPAAVAACAIVYWHSSHGQSPYVTAKALVIAGPVVAVVGMRGLLAAPLRPPPRSVAAARVLIALAFAYFCLLSSYQALRDEPVWPSTSTDELLSLDRVTRGQSVLFLGSSDYADWLFSRSDMSTLSVNSVSEGQAAPRVNKPNTYGTALDFDSVDPATINRFAWFVTPRTDYASQPPPGVVLVRSLPMYDLWRRTGLIAPRQVIEPAGAPGALLDCRTRAGAALSRRRGVAAVMATPVAVPLGGLEPGSYETVAMRLSAGSWQLSLQYTSALALAVTAGPLRRTIPPYLDRPGPIFPIGEVLSTGAPVHVSMAAIRPSRLTGPNLIAAPTTLVATRLPDIRTMVPLRHACGRYIDWYRLSGV